MQLGKLLRCVSRMLYGAVLRNGSWCKGILLRTLCRLGMCVTLANILKQCPLFLPLQWGAGLMMMITENYRSNASCKGCISLSRGNSVVYTQPYSDTAIHAAITTASNSPAVLCVAYAQHGTPTAHTSRSYSLIRRQMTCWPFIEMAGSGSCAYATTTMTHQHCEVHR
jgi:hypothetical protein